MVSARSFGLSREQMISDAGGRLASVRELMSVIGLSLDCTNPEDDREVLVIRIELPA